MRSLLLAAVILAANSYSGPARADATVCTEITALPFTITVQGVFCMKQNFNVNLATGNAITVNAGNVVIDFNGFRINNQAPLATNDASGVFARNRQNITLRNGFIRGFFNGIFLDESITDAAGSHLVEEMKVADSGSVGIWVEGDRSVVRENRIFVTGGGAFADGYGIIFQRADDGLVDANLISAVTETAQSNGIFVGFSNRVRITGNEVTHIDGSASDRGIVVYSVNRAIIAGNRLLNEPAGGTVAIFDPDDNSANISCLDNEIGGFNASPLAGCNSLIDNHVLYN